MPFPAPGTGARRRARGAGGESWIPTAGLERLLSRCLVQSEMKSAQHSHHRVQKETKKTKKPGERRRAGPPQLTQGVRLRIYLQRVLSRQRQHMRRRMVSPSVQASVGDRAGRPRVAAGRLWDRRSEHHGARALRAGGAGQQGKTPAESTKGGGGSCLPGQRQRQHGRAREEMPVLGGCKVSLKATPALAVGLPRAQPGRAR